MNRCPLFWRLEDSKNPAGAGARAAWKSRVESSIVLLVRKLCVVDALHGPRETREVPASEIRGRKVRWPWSYFRCNEPFRAEWLGFRKSVFELTIFSFPFVMLNIYRAFIARSFFRKEGNSLNRYPQLTIYRWSFFLFDSSQFICVCSPIRFLFSEEIGATVVVSMKTRFPRWIRLRLVCQSGWWIVRVGSHLISRPFEIFTASEKSPFGLGLGFFRVAVDSRWYRRWFFALLGRKLVYRLQSRQ